RSWSSRRGGPGLRWFRRRWLACWRFEVREVDLQIGKQRSDLILEPLRLVCDLYVVQARIDLGYDRRGLGDRGFSIGRDRADLLAQDQLVVDLVNQPLVCAIDGPQPALWAGADDDSERGLQLEIDAGQRRIPACPVEELLEVDVQLRQAGVGSRA